MLSREECVRIRKLTPKGAFEVLRRLPIKDQRYYFEWIEEENRKRIKEEENRKRTAERAKQKKKELEEKVANMSPKEREQYEIERRKKLDEINLKAREKTRLRKEIKELEKQAKERRLEYKGYKVCAYCGKNKLIQDFYSKDKYCKECRKTYYPKKKYKPKYPNTKAGRIKCCIDMNRKIHNDYTGTDEEFIEKISGKKFEDWEKDFFEEEKREREEEIRLNGYSSKEKSFLQIFRAHVRANLKASLKAHKVKKDGKTIEIIRCSFEDLEKHLEKTWEKNYGTKYRGEDVHIDHIIPLASGKTSKEILELCHWTNLQYLLPKDNFVKHDKMPDELEKEHFYENIKNNYQASLTQKEEF